MRNGSTLKKTQRKGDCIFERRRKRKSNLKTFKKFGEPKGEEDRIAVLLNLAETHHPDLMEIHNGENRDVVEWMDEGPQPPPKWRRHEKKMTKTHWQKTKKSLFRYSDRMAA